MDEIITQSFNRSDYRLAILSFIGKYKNSYLNLIAKKMNLDASNVKGALEGNKRYAYNLSLLNLKLIEKIKIGNYTYYNITEYGKEVLKIFSEGDKN